MKYCTWICLFLSFAKVTWTYQSGDNYIYHVSNDEGNISAIASSNHASGVISQSEVLNSNFNKYTDQKLASNVVRRGNNYRVTNIIKAGNVGAVLRKNSATARISQSSAANNVNNTILNQFGGGGSEYGTNHTTLGRTTIANINALVARAQGSNSILQTNVANYGNNRFENRIGTGGPLPIIPIPSVRRPYQHPVRKVNRIPRAEQHHKRVPRSKVERKVSYSSPVSTSSYSSSWPSSSAPSSS